jgi:hypothetical protein
LTKVAGINNNPDFDLPQPLTPNDPVIACIGSDNLRLTVIVPVTRPTGDNARMLYINPYGNVDVTPTDGEVVVGSFTYACEAEGVV